MCLGVPGRVIAVVDEARQLAEVQEQSGRRRRVSLALLLGDERPGPGDYVLVHAGMAMARVSEEEARAAAEMLEGFGDPIAEMGGVG